MQDKFSSRLVNILKAIGVILLFWYGAYYFKYIPILLLKLDVNNLNMKQQILLSMFASLLLSFIFFIIYRKELILEFKKFKKNFVENMDVGLRFWFLGLAIMMISNYILTFVFKAGGANNENALQEMLKASPYLMLITAGVVAPFNEEIVFRKTIKDNINNKWIFVFLSFVLFGGAHVIQGATSILDYFYIIPYGALGGVFALTYYKTDTVFTSMTFHMIHNTILVLLSIL